MRLFKVIALVVVAYGVRGGKSTAPLTPECGHYQTLACGVHMWDCAGGVEFFCLHDIVLVKGVK